MGLRASPSGAVLGLLGTAASGDLGPSLSAFPTPVNQLLAAAMPGPLGC
jgi:hypothetical protein